MIRMLVLIIGLMLPVSASAQSCNFGITDVDFGDVNVLPGTAVDVTATLTINCSGVSLTTVRICPSIEAGSAGANASARQMLGPTTTLNYQLYSDPGRTTVWGSYNWGFADTPPTIDINLALNGQGGGTRTIHARLLAGQTTATEGAYLSAFSAAATNFTYATLGIFGCPNLVLPQTAHPTFNVLANVVKNCSVSVPLPLQFGSHGVLIANVDASTDLLITCTNGTTYSIGLNGGTAAAPPTARKMANGANTVTYGLYSDGGRTTAWGDSIGVNTVGATGTGAQQTARVFGRVPPQTTPPALSYSDTIVVTINY